MTEAIQSFDTAIIGGGVIGCAIAWRLAQGGQRVAVIERNEIGREASWAAGGMLAPLAEADLADDFFNLCVSSRGQYATFAKQLLEASNIDIELRTEGTLYLALTDEDEFELEERWQWERSAGLNVKKLNADCVRKLEPLVNENLRWALKFPDDHQVNNRQLMQATYLAARKKGVQFFPFTEARNLLIEHQAGRAIVTGLSTSNGEIKANSIVIAAGAWSGLVTSNQVPVTPVRGQMLALEMPDVGINHVIYSRRGYVIPRAAGFIIAGSTTEKAGFEKRVTAEGFSAIIQNACEIAPTLKRQAIVETWAGLRPCGPDHLPILGRDENIDGLIYATAHYRNGILLTPITAQAISELILKGESSINLSPFSHTRFAAS